jgi:hypothetical protein
MFHPGTAELLEVHADSELLNADSLEHGDIAADGAPPWKLQSTLPPTRHKKGAEGPLSVPCCGEPRDRRLCAQGSCLVGRFPGELGFVTAEVPVGSGLAVDRAQQIERLDDAFRTQVEVLADQFDDHFVADLAGAEGIDHQRHRPGNADGVGHLHFAAVGETGGDDVLGHVARGIGGRAVDLRRVLAREGATAVPGGAAVGVDDDLAAGQAAVAVRAADDEAPGRVDQVAGVAGGQQFLRNHRLDDLLDHGFRDLRVRDVRDRAASKRRWCRSTAACHRHSGR